MYLFTCLRAGGDTRDYGGRTCARQGETALTAFEFAILLESINPLLTETVQKEADSSSLCSLEEVSLRALMFCIVDLIASVITSRHPLPSCRFKFPLVLAA